MPKVKLNLNRLPIPEKTARAHQIVAAMTGNDNFQSPQPTLAQVTAAINELDSAYLSAQTARQDAKNKTAAQNQKEDALDSVLTQLASYVESVSGGDEAKITSAGMEVRAPQTTTGDLNAPAGLRVTVGARESELDLNWNKVAKARSYVVERSPDPPTPTSWQHAAVATKSQVNINGLTSGTKYWFRVAAVGPNGQSPWSNPAPKFAP